VDSLPTWAVYAIAFATPVLAFAGVLIGQLVTRKGADELEARSKREELMRMLRWASELAISDDEPKARLGVAQLSTLLHSSLLTAEEISFVRAALAASIRNPVELMEQLGGEARATLVPDPALPAGPAVPLEAEAEREKED
jgi:hypothetical protein